MNFGSFEHITTRINRVTDHLETRGTLVYILVHVNERRIFRPKYKTSTYEDGYRTGAHSIRSGLAMELQRVLSGGVNKL